MKRRPDDAYFGAVLGSIVTTVISVGVALHAGLHVSFLSLCAFIVSLFLVAGFQDLRSRIDHLCTLCHLLNMAMNKMTEGTMRIEGKLDKEEARANAKQSS